MSLAENVRAPGNEGEVPFSQRGPAPIETVASFGFWLFLLSDVVMFSGLFAAYAVLADHTAGGPDGEKLFGRGYVLLETACLLFSSFTCGLMALAIERRSPLPTYLWAIVTFLLGAAFLGLEVREFTRMVAEGAAPSRSAFLSAFFALIGCHGLHVFAGLLWLLTMMAQVVAKGYREDILRRILCFNLFWHTLDIIWVGLFSLVYLVGLAL